MQIPRTSSFTCGLGWAINYDLMKTVIVIPAFNEGVSIEGVVRRVREAGFAEVIVVDDGSDDDTARLAGRAGARVIRHMTNRGAGAATATGLAAARLLGAQVVATLDADGQHDPSEIAKVIDPIVCGKADVSIGVRILDRGRMPVVTRIFNGVGNAATFILSGVRCRDSQSGFRAYGPRALTEIKIRSSGFEFCSETFREISRLDLRLAEVPVRAIYFDGSRNKGQNYATGLETILKLVLRSLMR